MRIKFRSAKLPCISFDISASIGRRWFHWPYEKKILLLLLLFRRQTKTDEYYYYYDLNLPSTCLLLERFYLKSRIISGLGGNFGM
jgi:hypothetical protein